MNTSTLIFLGHSMAILLSLVIALASIIVGNAIVGTVILLGAICPILMNLLVCLKIRGLAAKNSFSGSGFIFKRWLANSVFVITMSLVGVLVFHLPEMLYLFTLSSVWFIFYMVESLYLFSLGQERSKGNNIPRCLNELNMPKVLLVSYMTGLTACLVVIVVSLILAKEKVIATVLLGGICPLIVSFLNCIVISFLTIKYSIMHAFGLNMMGMLVKSVFMLFMTYLGISVLKLPPVSYIITLCSVWFIFHHVEAFYSQALINQKIREQDNARLNKESDALILCKALFH